MHPVKPSAWILVGAALLWSRLVGAQEVASEAVAQATGTTINLTWMRTLQASDCPLGSEVARDVEARLATDASPLPRATHPRVRATVTREAGIYNAHIVLLSEGGQELGSRTVESPAPDCDSLAKAAALTIALMIQIAPADADDRPCAGATPPANAPLSPPPSLASPSRVVPSGSVTLGVVGASGLMPTFALGVELRGTAALGRAWDAEVVGTYFAQQTIQGPDFRVATSLTSLALGGCYSARWGSWGAGPCAHYALGVRHVAVWAPTPTNPGDRLWMAVLPALRLRYAARKWTFLTTAALDIPTAPRDLVVQSSDASTQEVVFQDAAVGVQLGVSGGILFR